MYIIPELDLMTWCLPLRAVLAEAYCAGYAFSAAVKSLLTILLTGSALWYTDGSMWQAE